MFVKGYGGHCWDHTGRRFIDFICGYGPVILGHSDDEVNEAVREQLDRGILLPGPAPITQELVATLQDIFGGSIEPHFVKTGSEAVASAIRLARACSGRKTILRCGFHGWHDALVKPYLEWHQYAAAFAENADVLGVQQEPGAVETWDGESIEVLERFLEEFGEKIAALIFDPVQLREPLGENLHAIARNLKKMGVLLILDESKTCFRVGIRGVQGLYGIKPDITVLGKAIANGFPLAVVLAEDCIMRFKKSARLKGTYNSELASIAAAVRTIAILRREGTLSKIDALGRQLIDGANRVFERSNLTTLVRAVPYRWPCMPFFHFDFNLLKRHTDVRTDFFDRLASLGILFLKDHMNFICAKHTEHDLDVLFSSLQKIARTSPHWQNEQ